MELLKARVWKQIERHGVLIAVSVGLRPPYSGPPAYPRKPGADPEPCCAPAQYTHSVVGNVARLSSGKLSTLFWKGSVAYDSINKLTASETLLDFSNGTEDSIKIIFDYTKLKGYYISKEEGVVECQKFKVQGPDFPYNCIPDDAVFVRSATLGDRALVADQWYVSSDIGLGDTAHSVISIKGEGCIDLGSSQRIFETETGTEVRSESTTVYNFKLGIDDPSKYFKPPKECQDARVTKITDKLRRTQLYGGKVMLFD